MDRGAPLGSGKSQTRLKRLSKRTLKLKAYHAGLVTLSGLKKLASTHRIERRGEKYDKAISRGDKKN